MSYLKSEKCQSRSGTSFLSPMDKTDINVPHRDKPVDFTMEMTYCTDLLLLVVLSEGATLKSVQANPFYFVS